MKRQYGPHFGVSFHPTYFASIFVPIKKIQIMLLHIHKIEYCNAVHLNSAYLMQTSPTTGTAILNEYFPRRDLTMQGLAAIEIEETVENGVRTLSIKLSATLCGTPLPVTACPLAFILTSACGEKWLFGSVQAPYPMIIQNTVWASRAAEPSVTTLTVTGKGVGFYRMQDYTV